MPDIVISEFMDESALADLRARHDVLYDPGLVDNPEALHEAVVSARALVVRNRTQVRAALLDRAPLLECVGRLGVGLDNIDVDECRARNIAVFPATGANDLSVAEYVITAALVLLRGAWMSTDAMIAGQWPRQKLIGRELSGQTLGLVGYGGIARDLAGRAAGLGMRVIAYDPFLPADHAAWSRAQRCDLDELLAQSDVVSLHTPLTDDTRHLIGPSALGRMRRRAILVNAARGGVVDETALAQALRDGKIGGAALDVFEHEPLTADAAAKFKGLPNILLTPHIAGVTEESNVRVSELIAKRVFDHLAGQK